jgi:hypothetical protein
MEGKNDGDGVTILKGLIEKIAAAKFGNQRHHLIDARKK